jgi:hypothetical protein
VTPVVIIPPVAETSFFRRDKEMRGFYYEELSPNPQIPAMNLGG